ncbi:hypothetical protein [Clostridium oceanicum]
MSVRFFSKATLRNYMMLAFLERCALGDDINVRFSSKAALTEYMMLAF